VKAVLWTAFLTPAVVLAADGLTGRLGANPIEETIHRTGWWTLFLLTGTLAITPARRLTGSRAWDYILEDIAERPFITLGFGAWLILLALAFTSTRGWIRRLGRRWRRLHRLVYVAALAGGVHFFWRVKADEREPLVFLAVIICLLAVRVVIRARGGAGTSRRTATEAT
jgi:sulfoxide reductase heme-binding subunit YedZ